MSQEEFLLKWNDHHNSFFGTMKELSESEVLTDVTLACGGKNYLDLFFNFIDILNRKFCCIKKILYIYHFFVGQVFETHKLMLCACSTFFRSILTKRPDRHPIVFLKDVDPKQLEQLLQYMYQVSH